MVKLIQDTLTPQFFLGVLVTLMLTGLASWVWRRSLMWVTKLQARTNLRSLKKKHRRLSEQLETWRADQIDRSEFAPAIFENAVQVAMRLTAAMGISLSLIIFGLSVTLIGLTGSISIGISRFVYQVLLLMAMVFCAEFFLFVLDDFISLRDRIRAFRLPEKHFKAREEMLSKIQVEIDRR